MTTVIQARESQVVLLDTVSRLYVRILDNGALVTPTALSLRITTRAGALVYEDDITNTSPATRIVNDTTTDSVGVYYFPLGDVGVGVANTETGYPDTLVVSWAAVTPASLGTMPIIQIVRVITPRTASWVAALRVIIDKAAKLVDEDPNDPFYIGYTDAMLVQFLEGGLAWINGFQPYPTWSSIDAFPDLHWRILLDGAICDALTQQELFAVDTDIQYNDQGNSFTLEHQPKLSAILSSTWQRLEKTVPPMKRQYVMSGSMHVQTSPNYRLAQLLQAAPPGSTFRNAFTT